jgi:hypothetical protein
MPRVREWGDEHPAAHLAVYHATMAWKMIETRGRCFEPTANGMASKSARDLLRS